MLSGVALSGAACQWDASAFSAPAATNAPAADSPSGVVGRSSTGPTAAQVRAQLAAAQVVPAITAVDGYDLACGPGKPCSFGQRWTDNSTAPGAHNGCDTRNDVLTHDLTGRTYKPRTHECKVLSGTLHDPYTGRVIGFSSQRPSAVQIDHLYPRKRAWDAGAWRWTAQQRTAFANDVEVNLLAVDGPENARKHDDGPDGYLPPNAAYRCEYVWRYLRVANRYHLPITTADQRAITTVISRSCR